MDDSSYYDRVPWGASTVKHSELVTVANISPEQLAAGERERALPNYATAKYDRCNRCGEYYSVENPKCSNSKGHGEQKDRQGESQHERELVAK